MCGVCGVVALEGEVEVEVVVVGEEGLERSYWPGGRFQMWGY